VQLLLRELNHRSKNVLSVIQAIANSSASATDSEFLERFSRRLRALAVNQDMLAKNEWQGADLEELVRGQLAPFAPERRVHAHRQACRPLS
jgi:two-component sensor histidine kinase